MSPSWWAVYAAGLLLHAVCQATAVVRAQPGRRVGFRWRAAASGSREQRWWWAGAFAGVLAMIASSSTLDDLAGTAALSLGGVAVGLVVEWAVAAVHDRRLDRAPATRLSA